MSEIKLINGDCLEKIKDSSQDALSIVLNKYKPSEWYFGHFHISLSRCYKNCKWVALDTINNVSNHIVI